MASQGGSDNGSQVPPAPGTPPPVATAVAESASFDELHRAQIRYWSNTDVQKDEAFRNEAARIKAAFEREHGELKHYCFFSTIQASVGLTSTGELRVVDPPEVSDDAVEALVMESKGLYRMASSLLGAGDLKLVNEPLYGVVCGLFAAQESAKERGLTGADATAFLKKSATLHTTELKQARDLFEQMNRRQSQLVYFKGMLLGLLLVVVIACLMWFERFGYVGWFADQQVLVSWWVGGAGAVISVLQRMTKRTLTLDPTADTRTLFTLGSVRPFIGAVFAAVVFAILKSGWSPLTLAAESTESTTLKFQIVVIAFVAGFSERWAQDMLTNVQGKQLALPTGAAAEGGAAGAPEAPAGNGAGQGK